MNTRCFNRTVQGASHLKSNKCCEDASASCMDDGIAIAVVCDGHGGADYVRSAEGSRFACEIAEKNIRRFCVQINPEELAQHSNQLLETLEASIIAEWNDAVKRHTEEHPFTEDELGGVSEKSKERYLHGERIEKAYGTTVIAVAVTETYWFGLHIGDGKCVAVSPDGRFVQPIPWDPQCFLNVTTSICDRDAIRSFRHFYSKKLPVAVFCASDGVDDSFRGTEPMNRFYRSLLYVFSTSSYDDAVTELTEYLPIMSARGSGDDISIAAILDMDKIPELETVKSFDVEQEAARVVENAHRRKGIEPEQKAEAEPTAKKEADVGTAVEEVPAMERESEAEASQKAEPEHVTKPESEEGNIPEVVEPDGQHEEKGQPEKPAGESTEAPELMGETSSAAEELPDGDEGGNGHDDTGAPEEA